MCLNKSNNKKYKTETKYENKAKIQHRKYNKTNKNNWYRKDKSVIG